jgi:hypothetical protein
MVHLDHVNLAVRHLYKSAQRLRDEAGLDNYDGGWHPSGVTANRIVPLGDDMYLELSSIIDHRAAVGNAAAERIEAATANGDRLMAWHLRAETEEELERIAKEHGGGVRSLRPGRTLPDGTGINVKSAPDNHEPGRGLPSWFYFEDIAQHPSRVEVRHVFEPRGVAWLEVGGDPKEMDEWVGKETFARLPLMFVDRPAGLYALAVARPDGGEVVIRRE